MFHVKPARRKEREMSTRTALIISLVLILISIAFSLSVYNRLPDPMASHWGLADQPNGRVARIWGAYLVPLLSLGLLGLFLLIPMIDPLKANIAKFRGPFNTFVVFLVAFLVYVHALTLAWNLGYHNFNMSQAILPGVGLLFIVVGILLWKVKRNFFIGIRTPWTLSSDQVWDQTHRVGGWLFIGVGVLTLFTSLLGMAGLWVMLSALALVILGLVLYSYALYREETKA